MSGLLKDGDNTPHYQPPKPPFKLPEASWQRMKLMMLFGAVALILLAVFLLLVRRRDHDVPPPTVAGQPLANFYASELVQEAVSPASCDALQEVDASIPFYAVHPGVPMLGPALRGCGNQQACRQVAVSDSSAAAAPQIVRIDEREEPALPDWRAWIDLPTVLEADGERRRGTSNRIYDDESGEHFIERRAVLAFEGGELVYESSIWFGPREEDAQCMARRRTVLTPVVER